MNCIRKRMHIISTNFINLLLIILSLLSSTIEAQPQREFILLDLFCQNTSTFSSTYEANRDTVLSSLSSNGTRGIGFYNTTSGMSPEDRVYGLFVCRGDLPTAKCQECVTLATYYISQRCPLGTTAVVWYGECLVRYSNRNIFSVLIDVPTVPLFNGQNVTDQNGFNRLLMSLMHDAATQAANEPPGVKKFATREAEFSSSQTLYILVQCSPDLSGRDCNRCLQGAIANLSDCCGGRFGSILFNPSCTVRYELYKFYNETTVAPPNSEEEKHHESNWITILVASLSVTFGLAAISVSGFFIWRRKKTRENREHSQEIQLLDLVHGRIPNGHTKENHSGENKGRSEELPSIQLDILLAATNHFSNENKLGEGGFGSVYKGTLSDGKEIAVKRLSRTSGQGLVEFKNEVMLIARLQHRNLVRLMGCCLEENEKLLVYEFMPNKSLDVFLFDLNLGAQLDWKIRYIIIKGIARGILYLHEDSRLRIIHRDLKASNVLLDHNMNPKISDFGLARIFGEDKNEAKTNRVVGTYGYMAPEYAMQGLFSIKSDVFSFGVLLLEIISGKKNNGFLSEDGESLLTFAWKLWCKDEGNELIDQIIVPSCVASEVHKCIHIGLLCVQANPTKRPTMSSVVVMLASDTIILPCPTEPAFYVGCVVTEPSEPASNDGSFSINGVTVSNFLPR